MQLNVFIQLSAFCYCEAMLNKRLLRTDRASTFVVERLGDAGPRLLGMGHGCPPRNTPFLTCFTLPDMVVLGQTV